VMRMQEGVGRLVHMNQGRATGGNEQRHRSNVGNTFPHRRILCDSAEESIPQKWRPYEGRHSR
jgi:hypothetical protein